MWLFMELKGGKEAEEESFVEKTPTAFNNKNNFIWVSVSIFEKDLILTDGCEGDSLTNARNQRSVSGRDRYLIDP